MAWLGDRGGTGGAGAAAASQCPALAGKRHPAVMGWLWNRFPRKDLPFGWPRGHSRQALVMDALGNIPHPCWHACLGPPCRQRAANPTQSRPKSRGGDRNRPGDVSVSLTGATGARGVTATRPRRALKTSAIQRITLENVISFFFLTLNLLSSPLF